MLLICFFFLLLAPASTAIAATPADLQPWQAWVMKPHEDAACAMHYRQHKQRFCAWPGVLALTVTADGCSFRQRWQVQGPSWIALPGNKGSWPQDVTVDGKAAVVIDRQQRPFLYLTAGRHQLQGSFHWLQRPNAIWLPATTALLTLQLDGQPVSVPHIEKDGRLWLNEAAMAAPASSREQMQATIYRRISDDIPMQILIRLQLRVTGQAREAVLPRLFSAQAIPLRLNSPLPARLEQDGRLRLQLRPGQWTLDLVVRLPGPVKQLSYVDTGLVKEELWSWDARPALRLVEIEGVAAVDPSQTSLPAQWHDLPAYRLRPGSVMRLIEKRRGDPQPTANHLQLQADWWLDFDGQGYAFRDRIDGDMHADWRLDALPALQLGRVAIDGRNQLITRNADGQGSGVELRRGSLHIEAEGRFEGQRGLLPATGWRAHMNDVAMTLHLPPGWRLLAASGADSTGRGSWLERWTLLDLFLVLIATVAMYRLYGLPWGTLTLLCLSLLWHEPEAPRWIWLWLIACVALLRVAPAGKLQQGLNYLRHVSLIALLIIAVPFVINLLRTAMYPQLEQPLPVQYSDADAGAPAPETELSDAMPPQAAVPTVKRYEVRKMLRQGAEQPMQADASLMPEAAAPYQEKQVQTGHGLPSWQWSAIRLQWHGPVDATQQLRVWLLPPWLVSLLKVLVVMLLVLLTARLAGLSAAIARHWPLPWLPLAGLLLLLPWSAPPVTAGDFPSNDLLKTLEQRAMKPPPCASAQCAQISRMQLSIDEHNLQLLAELHAAAEVAVPVPGKRREWLPEAVWLDDQPVSLLRHNDALWLRLTPGVHRLRMQGRIHALDRLQLSLPLKPAQAIVQASDWLVSGLHRDGTVAGTLQFTRQAHHAASENSLQPAALPPLLQLERSLRIGRQWFGDYVLRRVSPTGSAVSVDIPLLAGESLISDGFDVHQGNVHVQLAPSVREVRWRTLLQTTPVLQLRAATTTEWLETWQLDVAPMWHVETSGLPPVRHQQGERWLPQWRPWPGESLQLQLRQPDAIQGNTKTLDAVHLNMRPGERSSDVSLSLHFLSSHADQHVLQLPPGAVLKTLNIDGQPYPLRPQDDGSLVLPLHPGEQTLELQWQQPDAIRAWLQTPPLAMGIHGVNADLLVEMPYNRWILMLDGPALGPAVLFWGVLLTIILAAVLLGRTRQTPLRTPQWLLLGIGLSQTSVAVAVLVIGWLFALAARQRLKMTEQRYFNTIQLGLLVLTVVAISGLVAAVGNGLLGQPEMQIVGNHSSSHLLHWYADQFNGALPQADIISMPMWVYRLLMLIWSLWLAFALLNWLKWGWQCFTQNGLWHKKAEPGNKEQAGHQPS